MVAVSMPDKLPEATRNEYIAIILHLLHDGKCYSLSPSTDKVDDTIEVHPSDSGYSGLYQLGCNHQRTHEFPSLRNAHQPKPIPECCQYDRYW